MAQEMISTKDITKRFNWETCRDSMAKHENLNLSCALRIADAVEVIAKNYSELIEERDKHYRWFKEEQEKNEKLRRTISGLIGYITRLKKKK